MKSDARKRLLDAAEEELIVNDGHIEMAPVAKRAKSSIGLAYHHFGSKSGLIAAVVDRFYDPLRHVALGAAIPSDLEWPEREFERMRAITDYFYDSPLAPIIAGRLARESEVLDIERAHMIDLLELGAKNIAQGQKLKVVSDELEPSTTVAMLMGGHRAALDQAILSDPRPAREEIVEQIWRFTVNAIGLDEKHKLISISKVNTKLKRVK